MYKCTLYVREHHLYIVYVKPREGTRLWWHLEKICIYVLYGYYKEEKNSLKKHSNPLDEVFVEWEQFKGSYLHLAFHHGF